MASEVSQYGRKGGDARVNLGVRNRKGCYMDLLNLKVVSVERLVPVFIRLALTQALPEGSRGRVEIGDIANLVHKTFVDEKTKQPAIDKHQCRVRVYNFLKSSKEFTSKDCWNAKTGHVAIKRVYKVKKVTETTGKEVVVKK